MPKKISESKFNHAHILKAAGASRADIANSLGVSEKTVQECNGYVSYFDYINGDKTTKKPHRSNVEIIGKDIAKRFDRMDERLDIQNDRIEQLIRCIAQTDARVRNLCDMWKQ